VPNIEIHGLNRTESAPLAERFIAAIKEKEPALAKDAVITLCDDHCIDLDGVRQPFIRICSSESKHFAVLVEILKQFKMDIECLTLITFIPAEK
jgi:hypothetical protein